MCKNNCFALSRKGLCKALEGAPVCNEKCAFYQSKKEARESLYYAYARLCTLSAAEQQRIADKYYDGKMPWQEGGGL